MLDIIYRLLIAIGITIGQKGSKPVVVIDSSTGISYAIGVTNGSGGCITANTDVYFLVKDQNGNYKLVHK